MTDSESQYATVNVDAVEFTDNSEVMPTVTVTGFNASNNQYEIGGTDIKYVAVDSSGNTGICSFTITVVGKYNVKYNFRTYRHAKRYHRPTFTRSGSP